MTNEHLNQLNLQKCINRYDCNFFGAGAILIMSSPGRSKPAITLKCRPTTSGDCKIFSQLFVVLISCTLL